MQENLVSMNSKLQMGGCSDGKKGKRHAYLKSVLFYFKCLCNISIHAITCRALAYHHLPPNLRDFQLQQFYRNLIRRLWGNKILLCFPSGRCLTILFSFFIQTAYLSFRLSGSLSLNKHSMTGIQRALYTSYFSKTFDFEYEFESRKERKIQCFHLIWSFLWLSRGSTYCLF